MTTPHPFAALVRRLDAEASKAPWRDDDMPYRLRDGHPEVRCVTVGDGVEKIHVIAPDATPESRRDAALIVTLRNAAPEVAALVEAVEAYRVSVGRYDECAKAHPVGPHLAVLERQENTARGAMFAALDALARAARDATSGPADPTRIEGSPK